MVDEGNLKKSKLPDGRLYRDENNLEIVLNILLMSSKLHIFLDSGSQFISIQRVFFNHINFSYFFSFHIVNVVFRGRG